jgi:hypothetical protein
VNECRVPLPCRVTPLKLALEASGAVPTRVEDHLASTEADLIGQPVLGGSRPERPTVWFGNGRGLSR